MRGMQGEILFYINMLGFFLAFLLSDSLADDRWYCNQVASERQGNKILSCGIGTGVDERAARINAFDNAKEEFNRVCDASDDCRGHLVRVEPMRTSCIKKLTNIECYRLLVFEIGSTFKPIKKGDSYVCHYKNPFTQQCDN